ncbi:MAG: TauD/TfdA family dioxygenase [Beijerinckiaceae bacterium]
MIAADISPVTGPQVWTAADFAARTDWRFDTPDAVVDDLDSVARTVRAGGFDQDSFDFDAPDFPSLHAFAADLRRSLQDGTGVAQVKGFPVERYSAEELKVLFLVLGRHMGLIGPQAPRKRGIGEVMDIEEPGPKEFYYHRGGPLPMHMDPVDVVGLLTIRKAKKGGLSGIVSSMRVHNEILAERPDLLALLYRGFYNRRRQSRLGAGGSPLTDYRVPVYADIGGETICSYLPQPIVMAVEEGLVRLDDDERDALAMLDRTAERPDLVYQMDLEPGDLQFLNNRCTMHNRGDYEDWQERERRRLLLRLWLTMPGWKKYPPEISHTDVEQQRTPV